MDLKIEIPNQVKVIISILEDNGYEAYIVGGCVRDSLINRKPNDFDITTNAKPDVVLNLFNKAIPTGLEHGTITVIMDNENFEITTYRTEGKYIDNRHPSEVNFVSNLKEDLSRRDFTINAMAYNEKNNLKDYFGGIEDLNNKIIRTVGNPYERFNEDALRMIRAVRFSAQLNFKIDIETLDAIKDLNSNLTNISKERIREEFNKILKSNPRYIKTLIDTNLLCYIMPELNKAINYKNKITVEEYEQIIQAASLTDNKIYLRLAIIFHKVIDFKLNNFSIDKVKDSLKFLKYDNVTIKNVINLVKYFDNNLDSKYYIKKMLNILGEDFLYDLLKLKNADIISKNNLTVNKEILKLENIWKNLNEIISNNECYSIKELKVNGDELIEIGIKKGKEIGLTLNYLLDEVMKDNTLNNKEILLKLSEEKFVD